MQIPSTRSFKNEKNVFSLAKIKQKNIVEQVKTKLT